MWKHQISIYNGIVVAWFACSWIQVKFLCKWQCMSFNPWLQKLNDVFLELQQVGNHIAKSAHCSLKKSIFILPHFSIWIRLTGIPLKIGTVMTRWNNSFEKYLCSFWLLPLLTKDIASIFTLIAVILTWRCRECFQEVLRKL